MARYNTNKLNTKRSRKMVQTEPDPALISSLRRAGYKWHEATLDIIDNSVDAIKEKMEEDPSYQGGKITISAMKNGNGEIGEIIVIDTGIGIPKKALEEAVTLGKSSKRKTQKTKPRLGVFGMGLNTAGMALSDNITVMSRAEGKGVHCVNWRPPEDGFSCELFSSRQYTEFFEKHVGTGSGTIVRLQDLRCSSSGGRSDLPRKVESFYKTLRARASHVYRHIMNPSSPYHVPIDLVVGATQVGSDSDPLKIGDEDTEILIGGPNGEFVTYQQPNGQQYKIRMIHHRRSSGGDLSANRDKYENQIGQYMPGNHYRHGAYWIRQGREIYRAPLWKPKQGISNLYAEIIFEDTGLEEDVSPVQMDFGKTGVLIHDDAKNFLVDAVFEPQVKKQMSKLKKEREQNRSVPFSEVCEKMSEKVLSPNTKAKNHAPKIKRIVTNINKANNKVVSNSGSKRNRRGQVLNIEGATNIQFDIEFRGWPGDIAFCLEDEGTRHILVLNEQHPWVKRSIIDTFDKGDHSGAAYIIQMCAAFAQSLHSEEEDAEKIAEILTIHGHLLNVYDLSFGEWIASEESDAA